jgi:GNAT superfamily N-acetyltransferase
VAAPASPVGGIARIGFRALARLGVYRRLFLLERMLDAPIPDWPLPAGVRVETLGPDDLSAYAALRAGQGRATCARRWARGDWCFATWRGGVIVGALWVATGRASIDYLGQHLHLDTEEVYSYDLFTAPEARGLGLTRASRPQHLGRLRDLGYRRLLGSVSPDNAAAWAVQEAVGFRRIALVGFVGVGPRRRHFCRTVGSP